MTDAQFYGALLAGAIGLFGSGGFLRWCVLQWLADRAADRADRKEEKSADRSVTIANTAAMTTLAVRVEGLEKKLGKVAEDFESISGVHEVAPQPPTKKKRAQTPAHGAGLYRIPANKDGE